MISYRIGNLFSDVDVDAYVNLVTTMGVLGKGINSLFRKHYPESCAKFKKACLSGEVKVGEMFVVEENGKTIINFPTKKEWWIPAKKEWLLEGIHDLAQVIKQRGIKRIAIPAIGYCCGGDTWEDVQESMKNEFSSLEHDVIIFIFLPYHC